MRKPKKAPKPATAPIADKGDERQLTRTSFSFEEVVVTFTDASGRKRRYETGEIRETWQ